MTNRARAFIALTIASGVVLVAGCLYGALEAHPSIYLTFFALALLASALKVHLPGIPGTISVNFLFILVGIAAFTFSETVLLAAAASIVQCLWKARRRPRLVQVSFNVAALAISSGIAYRASHLLTRGADTSLAVLLSVSGCLYFAGNTLLVSGVVALVEHKSLFPVWQRCYLWSFPYYLLGAAVAGLVVATGRSQGWMTSFAILPCMYLVYLFYRMCVERLAVMTR